MIFSPCAAGRHEDCPGYSQTGEVCGCPHHLKEKIKRFEESGETVSPKEKRAALKRFTRRAAQRRR